MDEVSGSVDRKDFSPLLICSFKRSTGRAEAESSACCHAAAPSIKYNHLHETGVLLNKLISREPNA